MRLSPVRRAMAPSCGIRFSAMSIFASILNRETIMMKTLFDGGGSSWSMPSMRSRNLQPSSNGSRWMSLARLRSACSRIWLTMRTIRPLASAGGDDIEIEDVLIVIVTIFLERVEVLGPLADGLGVASGAIERVQPRLDDRQGRDHRD